MSGIQAEKFVKFECFETFESTESISIGIGLILSAIKQLQSLQCKR